MKLSHLIVPLIVLGGFLPCPALGQTNRQLADGAYVEFEAADKKMNAAYQKLLAVLDDEGKSTLREAQRAWIAWRDAQAEFDSHQFGSGKLRPLERNGSLRVSTEARTARLLEDYKRFK
ncbi:MAG: hypothetical protein QOH88_1397 [Verrucomicrobiota bacterium]|jgi:uncharacterized protein YecT (DUF1311 family)